MTSTSLRFLARMATTPEAEVGEWGHCSSCALSWSASPSTAPGRLALGGSHSRHLGRRYVTSGIRLGAMSAVQRCMLLERSFSSSSSSSFSSRRDLRLRTPAGYQLGRSVIIHPAGTPGPPAGKTGPSSGRPSLPSPPRAPASAAASPPAPAPQPHQVRTTSRTAPAAIFTSVRCRAQRYRGSLGYSAPAISRPLLGRMPCELVGVAGFEPAASSSRTKRAAKLRYTPPLSTGLRC
jgi:hypothetical protein